MRLIAAGAEGPRPYLVLEGVAVQELEHEVRARPLGARRDQAHDVRAPEDAQRGRFALEAHPRDVGPEPRGRDLDRDLGAGRAVARAIDVGRAPRAEQ